MKQSTRQRSQPSHRRQLPALSLREPCLYCAPDAVGTPLAGISGWQTRRRRATTRRSASPTRRVMRRCWAGSLWVSQTSRRLSRRRHGQSSPHLPVQNWPSECLLICTLDGAAFQADPPSVSWQTGSSQQQIQQNLRHSWARMFGPKTSVQWHNVDPGHVDGEVSRPMAHAGNLARRTRCSCSTGWTPRTSATPSA